VQREGRDRAETPDECVVVLWRGYVTGQYQAYDPRSDEPFLCSPTFRTWRPPWQPRLPIEDSPAAAAALRSLANELSRHGWRSDGGATSARRVFVRGSQPRAAASRKRIDPARIAEPFVLRALAQIAGDDGATAAEVGRALYGEDAAVVRGLPQQVGRRLAKLQLKGEVVRRDVSGVTRWSPARESDRALGG
jgi:hypothetical protein